MAADLELRVNAGSLLKFAHLMRAAGAKAPLALANALNHTGEKTKTAMVRSLTAQTGLPRKTIVHALHIRPARPARLMAFRVSSKGGNIRLKYFQPHETAPGVTAAPHGQRRLFPGSWVAGGEWGNRVKLNMGGQVFIRVGNKRLPIELLRSDVFIPMEMISGATAEAFRAVSTASLQARIRHELLRVLP